MNVDPRKINLSEKDLEDYVFDNPEMITLPYSNTPIKEWFGRQLHIPSGIIDLAGITENNKIAVIELKNTEFVSSHITQVCRYSSDIESAMFRAGVCEEPYVYKLLIGTHRPSSIIINEAFSVNVFIYTLNIEFDLKIGGFWDFSSEYKKDRNDKILKLSQLDTFVKVATISQARQAAEMEEENYG